MIDVLKEDALEDDDRFCVVEMVQYRCDNQYCAATNFFFFSRTSQRRRLPLPPLTPIAAGKGMNALAGDTKWPIPLA